MRYSGTYEALPNPDPYGSDPYACGGWQRVMVGQTIVPVGSRSKRLVEKKIEATSRGWGEGSRGIVWVEWKGAAGGHVFNFVRQGGSNRYFDAQVGREIDIQEYLRDAKPTRTTITRIDNLSFRPGVEKDLFRRVK